MRSSFSLSACLLLVAAASPSGAWSAGFAAGLSPSKFELRAKPGEVVRDTVTILNPGNAPADYLLRTADWGLNDASGIEFVEDAFADGSCRPWVRLERK